ncbi:DnaJ [Nosema bombycis CQ1]|uniref:DnaJ n=1 Tax=Nosema bombycis (strain CQ1 / CVCC 102059) TaxID=578461 RepID=R0MI49_NOSB1|nr:DnaJ [Nosema bombycis CQ1]|eukprot:EOB12458.1 DnaJ [Nosema bombycis CQ1]
MGLFFSNINNPPLPHEVLGLPPLFTKSQARSQYLKLVRSNPFLYNSAYDCIKRDPPNLNLYNNDVLRDSTYVIDLFDRIGDFSGFKCPEFRSPDFYKKFKNYQSPRKFKREEERNLFNFKVRKIIKEVYKIYEQDVDMVVDDSIKVEGSIKVDDSIKVVEASNEGVYTTNVKKEKQFKCEYCSKGFRSKNQLINHFKSKKHFEKIKEKEEEPKGFIKKQIEKCEEGKGGGVEEGGSEVNEGGEVKVEEGGIEDDNNNNTFIPSPYISKDPIAFRTCSRCNKRFDTRIKMIEHIKKEHK